jgi:hypothetical protein
VTRSGRQRCRSATRHQADLTWTNSIGLSQSRDYEFDMRFGVTVDPLIGIPDFDHRIRQAQAIQCRVSTLSGLRYTVDYTSKSECPLACTNERLCKPSIEYTSASL